MAFQYQQGLNIGLWGGVFPIESGNFKPDWLSSGWANTCYFRVHEGWTNLPFIHNQATQTENKRSFSRSPLRALERVWLKWSLRCCNWFRSWFLKGNACLRGANDYESVFLSHHQVSLLKRLANWFFSMSVKGTSNIQLVLIGTLRANYISIFLEQSRQ